MYQVPFEFPLLSYDEASAMAHDCGFFGNTDDPLLETVVEMLDELGRPDSAFDVIQIAGTNGKTSTSRFTAAILSGQGKKCALYTSPELVEMRERMEVSGKPVDRGVFARGISVAAESGRRVNARRSAAGQKPYRVTEFDLLTVAALVVFAEAGVDVAVLEVGLGGRWDATTATHPVVTCVTGIGLDHCHILGDTLEDIAAEKAAVIKAGQRCVLGVGTATPDSVEDVILSRCREVGVEPVLLRPEVASDAAGEMFPGEVRVHADLLSATYTITKHPVRLGGPLELDVRTTRATYVELAALKPSYQAANIACAVCVSEEYLGCALEPDALFTSVVQCPTPGRFQLLRAEPPLLIDACHNPQSVAAFLAAVRAVVPAGEARPTLLCAVLKDKDVQGIVDLLASEFDRVAVTQTSSPRALCAHELSELFCAAGCEVVGEYPTVADALSALCGESCVACGSITLAGEVAAAFA